MSFLILGFFLEIDSPKITINKEPIIAKKLSINAKMDIYNNVEASIKNIEFISKKNHAINKKSICICLFAR